MQLKSKNANKASVIEDQGFQFLSMWICSEQVQDSIYEQKQCKR